MEKTALGLKIAASQPFPCPYPIRLERAEGIPVPDLPRLVESWLLDGESAEHTDRTLEGRRFITDKLLWFCRREGYASLGPTEMRRFFVYLRTAHASPEGRWDNPHMTRAVSSRTVSNYHNWLRTFFRYLVDPICIRSATPFRPLKWLTSSSLITARRCAPSTRWMRSRRPRSWKI